MSLASFSLDNRVTTYVITLLLVVGGIAAFNTMPSLEDPEFTIKQAVVVTNYPGATAEEVAEEVSDKIEKAVQKLGQTDYVESTSQPGLSIVNVYIKDKYDATTLPQVWDELRRKVGDVQGSLPPGAGPSIVNDDFGDVFGVFLAVYGDGFTYRELKDHVDKLEKELVLVDDVSKVSLFGVQDEVIYIEVSRARFAALGISETAIYTTLAKRNLIEPAGRVELGRERIRFVPTGELTSVEAIGNTLIQGIASDRQIYLRDIATITREYEDPPGASMRFDGRPAIGVGISTVQGGNVVSMGDAIQARLAEMLVDTPIGIEIGEIYFQGNMVTAAVNGFVVSLLQAILIVIGVLLFAMGVRSGILIGAILLITVLATFVVMKTQGIALERISLGALVIALGMLVDNAIVVVEGILVRAQKGMDRAQAAKEVVAQTMWPLFGATWVAIMAFGALGLSQDSTGEYCRSLFQVISYSLLLSWVLAITVTPLLCVNFLKVDLLPEGHDPYGGVFFRGYKAFLSACIKARWMTVGAAVLLLMLAIKGFAFVNQSFFPSSTTPAFTFDVWLPQGTDIRQTGEELAEIEAFVDDQEEVTSYSTYVGQGALRYLLTYTAEQFNTSYGQLIVQVDTFENVQPVIKRMEAWVAEHMPDALVYGKPYVLGPGGGSDIEIRIRGEDPAQLRAYSEQIKAMMLDDGDSRDVRDDWREQVKVVRPQVLDSQASRLGLSRREINSTLQRNFEGSTVGIYREGDTLIPIKSRAPPIERSNVDNVRDVQVWSPVAGSAIPLSQVISGFETVFENGIIERRDRVYTITPQCNSHGTPSVLFGRLRTRIEDEVKLKAGYAIEWGGEYENSSDAQEALAANFGLTILIMVLIVIILFNSLKQPTIIWLTVPLALVGVTAGLLISGEPFGFMALLGLLSLIGMLIKNAIVLVDEIDMQIREGKPRYTAILDSCVSRLRPVSMAAFTTVLGMIPLLPDVFFASLAVTVMGGLSFATILTLIVVPVLYAIFFRIKATETGTQAGDPGPDPAEGDTVPA